ncbi:MAG: hypothetical protein JST00_33805 [Deltaproteobacteria bacterium]|nr:hypothetical protein [Deltaproteobacteria bacterium]
MSESTAWESIHRLVLGGSWFVGIVCQIVMIVVVATVVRRHRPDAWHGLLAWAIASSVALVVAPALQSGAAFFARGDGISGFLRASAIVQALMIPVHLVVFALLVRGLVRIAQPPPKVDVGPTPPYR